MLYLPAIYPQLPQLAPIEAKLNEVQSNNLPTPIVSPLCFIGLVASTVPSSHPTPIKPPTYNPLSDLALDLAFNNAPATFVNPQLLIYPELVTPAIPPTAYEFIAMSSAPAINVPSFLNEQFCITPEISSPLPLLYPAIPPK